MIDLELADLERFDGRAPAGRVERRFCCPHCGSDKPLDAAHRSLTVNKLTGAWHCHRCDESGKLRDWFEERPTLTRAQRSRAAAVAAIAGRGRTTSAARILTGSPAAAPAADWSRAWDLSGELVGSPGAQYVEGRSIPLQVAQAAGVRWSPDWYGRGAVLFPISNRAGELVAVSGRYVDTLTPKTRAGGSKAGGVFLTAAALDLQVVAIVEGQFDALALAAAGVPAVALIGTSYPEWLPPAVGLRACLIATDADEAGDACAARLLATLPGARSLRLRPRGAKDWADKLVDLGVDRLAYTLRGFAADPLRSVKVDEIEGVDSPTSDDIRAAAALELVRAGRFDEARFVARMVDDLEHGLALDRQIVKKRF